MPFECTYHVDPLGTGSITVHSNNTGGGGIGDPIAQSRGSPVAVAVTETI